MVEIIEQNDYNKPANGEDVIEIDENGAKRKLFKIQEGVWIKAEPKINNNPSFDIGLFDANYCQIVEAKSKYLGQMTALFKRINQAESGSMLLDVIERGAPLDLSRDSLWNRNNFIESQNGDRFRVSVIIEPSSNYLEISTNGYVVPSNVEFLEGRPVTISFNPDIIFSIKRGNELTFTDPAVTLYHELLHGMHSNYGVRDERTDQAIEEYLTFGEDVSKINENLERHNKGINTLEEYHNRYLRNRYLKTIEQLNKLPQAQGPEEEENMLYLADKYFLTQDVNGKFIANEDSFKKFLDNTQFNYSEVKFAQEVDAPCRISYDEALFLPFKVDVTNPNVYTVETGFKTSRAYIGENLPLSLWPEENMRFKDAQQEADFNRLLTACGRNKRSINNKKETGCIPLESIEEEYEILGNIISLSNNNNTKKQNKNRVKIAAGCSPLEEIFEKLDTVYNKAKKIPQKLLKYHTNSKVPEVETKDNPKPQTRKEPPELSPAKKLNLTKETRVNKELIPISENCTKSRTFKIGKLVGFDRLTPSKILDAHRFNHDLDHTKTAIEFHHEDPRTCLECGDKTFTFNEEISIKMKAMFEGKAMIKGSQRVADIARYVMWTFTLIEDFTGRTGKDGIHIANDVASIIPLLGQAMNIIVDVADGNYEDALELLGICILLEVFPELALPVLIGSYLLGLIKKRDKQREMLGKEVWNILMEREQLLDSSLEHDAESLAIILVERIAKVASVATQQQMFTASAIIHNVKYYGQRYVKTPADKRQLDLTIQNMSEKLQQAVDRSQRLAVDVLYEQMSKTVTEEFIKNSTNGIKNFNEQTKTEIKDLLKTQSKAMDIPEDIVDEALEIVDEYIRRYNIANKIDKELKILQKIVAETIKPIEEAHVPLLHIGISEQDELKEFNDVARVIPNNNVYPIWGRNRRFLKICSNGKLTIRHDWLQYVILNKPFTIDFWIKIPPFVEGNKTTLISNGLNNKNGWGITLHNKSLNFIIATKNKDNPILALSHNDICNNIWTKVTIVNNPVSKVIQMFINGIHTSGRFYDKISKSDMPYKLNKQMNIGFPIKNSSFFYNLDDFKIYTIPFNYEDIANSIITDYSPHLLYDYFGDHITPDLDYLLMGRGVDGTNYVFGYEDNQPKLKEIASFRDVFMGNPITIDFKGGMYNRNPRALNNGDVVEISLRIPINSTTKKAVPLGVYKNARKKAVEAHLVDGSVFKAAATKIVIRDRKEELYTNFKIFTPRDYQERIKGTYIGYKTISFISSKNDIMDGLVIMRKYDREIETCHTLLSEQKSNIHTGAILLKEYINDPKMDPLMQNTIFYLVPAQIESYYNFK